MRKIEYKQGTEIAGIIIATVVFIATLDPFLSLASMLYVFLFNPLDNR
jgi:hypothetical protein